MSIWSFLVVVCTAVSWGQLPTPLEPVKTTVTVTGTRGSMELDRSPVPASVVTREEIETRNIRQVDQALTLTEGVVAFRTRGPSDNDFGLGLRGFAGRSGQSRTLILVDGQPVNNSYIGSVNWSTFSVSEMERVEVARGPFSALYGGNAMGGVVNLITRPVDKRHFEAFGQFGSRDTTNYSLRVADRFVDKLGMSFGYSRLQTGGYEAQAVMRPLATGSGGTPVAGAQAWPTSSGGLNYQVGWRGKNWFHQEAFRLRGEYTFSPKLFASVQWVRQSRGDGWDAYRSLVVDASGRPVDNGAVTFADGGVARRLTMTPANFIGTPTGAVLHIMQAQVLATLTPQWNLRIAGGVNRSPGDWYVTPGATATLAGGPGSYVNQTNQGVYGNLQASRTRSGQTFITGMEMRHDRARIASQAVPSYAVRQNGAAYDSQGLGRTVNPAVYAQWQASVSERLLLVAGGRWDYWHTYDGGTQTGIHQPLQPAGERSANAFTGKLAASYALPGNWRLRGSIGNAFRNPSVYEMYRDLVLSGILYAANPNVKAERLLAWEGGVQRVFGAGNAVEATFFENRVSDLIYRTTDFAADPSGRLRRLTNAGLGRTRGVELSARQRLGPWLQLRQFYTWNDPVITSNPDLPATVGRTLPFVPRHTVGYLATAVRGRWAATWGGRYVSAVYATDTNTDTTRGVPGGYSPFFEMEGSVTFQLTRYLTVVANAENLLDRRYFMFYQAPGRAVYGGLRLRL